MNVPTLDVHGCSMAIIHYIMMRRAYFFLGLFLSGLLGAEADGERVAYQVVTAPVN